MAERTRAAVRSIFEAAVAAVRPENLLPAVVRLDGDLLRIADATYPLRPGQKVHVFGSGKAVSGMARALAAILGDRLAAGCLVGNTDSPLPPFTVVRGGHPVPDQGSVAGGSELCSRLAMLRDDDLFIYLLSGGSSALIEKPVVPLTLDDIRQTSRLLLHANVPIHKVNIVRKHLSAIKGGRLGQCTRAAGAVLVLSDVVGDDLTTIGSAPLYADASSFRDALAVIDTAGIADRIPAVVRAVLEEGAAGLRPDTPDLPAATIRHFCIGTNRRALAAAAARAGELGYAARIMTSVLEGDAESVAAVLYALGWEIGRHGSPFPPPVVLLFGGETTVAVTGGGRGGRNQQLALAFLARLGADRAMTLLAAGTDGIDGNSHAAGATADAEAFRAAAARGLDPARYLAENDATGFFEKVETLVVTGPTGTNVMDVTVLIVEPEEDA
ncbi:MAG: DUF4147 domain-containing protein [Thermodesulfobacteriota bacterium]